MPETSLGRPGKGDEEIQTVIKGNIRERMLRHRYKFVKSREKVFLKRAEAQMFRPSCVKRYPILSTGLHIETPSKP
jgi:hypothetical protein